MRITWVGVVLFLAWWPATARQVQQICGSYPDKSKEELALHRRSAARKAFRARAAGQASTARDFGDIAVMDDSDGVIARRNAFNLDRRSIQFIPANASATAYSYRTGDLSYDSDAASNGAPLAGIRDDDSREMALPFPFPFYGRNYSRIWVNSDGNLTFEAADADTGERSLGRLTSGSPRIAPFFSDLDPSTAGAIRVLAQSSRVVVTWAAVPEYSSVGAGPANTFQVVLQSDGRITVSFQSISTRTAVVGIAPGHLSSPSSIVSFSTGVSGQYEGAIVERFTNIDEVDIVTAAQKFYETHDDAYDYLVVYNNLNVAAGASAIAYEVTVKSNRLGIGDPPTDVSAEYGSAGRLQSVLNLGPLSQYPNDPNSVVSGRTLARDTPLTILGHESGHLWLAFASVRDPADSDARPMLGRQSAHWTFGFNSEASLLEGNRIQDNGPDARPRFVTTGTVEGYSPLDQYLMGLRPPEEVPPTFLVTNTGLGLSRQPERGVAFSGDRRDVTISELIQAEGRRTPDSSVSQRHFRFGFILITASATNPTQEELAKVNAFRTQFEPAFVRFTGARAQADTALRKGLQISAAPAAGVLEGGTTPAALTIPRTAESPIVVRLAGTSGITSFPDSVTIPAGQSTVAFSIGGLRSGVEELTATPSDSRYETAFARIQVQRDLSTLRITAIDGDKQQVNSTGALANPIVAQVTDRNNLPYGGVSIRATSSAGGAVDPATAVTDLQGNVRFQWRPGSTPGATLQLTVVSAPSATVQFTTSKGKPAISPEGVLNAASFRYGLTPGALSTITGVNLAGGAAPVVASTPLPTELAGVQVFINSQPVELLYVSERQINFLAPTSLSGTAEVLTSFRSGTVIDTSETVRVPVKTADPGVFFDAASGIAAALVSNTGQTTITRPVAPGEYLEIYATGLGALLSANGGRLAETARRPVVTIGGMDAPVLFSGAAPNFPGLYQVNVQVPAGVPAGSQPLLMRMDDAVSNETRVNVR